jgi:hypothetical protein
MSLAHEIIDLAEPHSHYVQFYKADEPQLNRNVGYYLWEGLLRGDGLIVIATEQRRRSLSDHLGRLGVDLIEARNEGQLVFHDAGEMLGRFMVAGEPDQVLFEQVIDEEIRRVRPRAAGLSIRAYGEMVGMLWEEDRFDAAIRLEEYWNKVLHVSGITLFCGYPIDVFGDDLQSARMQAVLCHHTHLMPGGADADLDSAVHMAIHDELGPESDALRLPPEVENSGQSARLLPAEAAIVWLRKNIPERAHAILSKARSHYEKAQRCAA